jgi:hypothetical protein
MTRTREASESRDELAYQADVMRSKLIHTLGKLARRRHETFSWRFQIHRHVRAVAFGGVVLIGAATTALLLTQGGAATTRHRRRARWILAKRLWTNPRRALRATPRSFPAELARSLGLKLVTFALAFSFERVFRARS